MTARRAVMLAVLAAALSSAAAAFAAEAYQYDTAGRITDVAYQNGGSIHYTYDANGNILSIVTSLAAAVGDDSPSFQFALGPATPNPGSGPRNLLFSIPSSGHVALRVFDVAGRQIATLIDKDLGPGRYEARFGTDRWAAGVYYYRLTMGARSRTGRLVVLR